MKVVNDLLGYDGLKIVQNTEYFSFSLDSVLLANFVTIDKKTKNVLDIGTGNAPIPMILSTKEIKKIFGFEIQPEIFEMAQESLKINSLSEKIQIFNDDIKNISKYFEPEFFDLIVTNPPYFKIHELSKLNIQKNKAIARHELFLKLEDIISIAFKYLKNNGRFAMVYRTERITEVLSTMQKNKIEPKRITFIFSKEGCSSNLFLVEGMKNSKPGLKSLNYIFTHKSNGEYTDEIKKFFC